MYKVETHLHTKEGSACSSMTGAEQARARKADGYDTIIVTDHFFRGNSRPNRDQSWEGYVNDFCSGYENAKAEGDKIGLNVLFGWEEAFHGAEFLVYGLDKEWLLRHPEMISWTPPQQWEAVKRDGGMIIQPHPFRQRDYLIGISLYPDYVDGCEVINSSQPKIMNDRANWYADQFGLRKTAGSDIHHAYSINGGMLFEQPIVTIQDYIDAIMNQKPYQLLDVHSEK